MQVIDIHNHFFPSSWPDLAARYGTPNWPWIKHTEAGKADIMVGDRFFRHIYSACWDPEVRLQEMDRDGIDLQVISATPVLFAYDRLVEHALGCAQLFNDAALELCSRGKGRLKSFCQVPLQDIDAACKELSRCMQSGHVGVQIGNHVGGKNLDDSGIVTFLQHCADQSAAVLVHPWEMFGQERMPKYMMPWTVGMPAETQLSVVALTGCLASSASVSRMAAEVFHTCSGGWKMPGIIIRSRAVSANIHPATTSTVSIRTPRCSTNVRCNSL
jgi:aminocarboxymuconate-semialdehyde decarboxylase